MNNKLGIQNYKIVGQIGRLSAPRKIESLEFLLILDEYEIIIEKEYFEKVSNCDLEEYQKCEFRNPTIFVEAARAGSLCSQICLNYFNIKY